MEYFIKKEWDSDIDCNMNETWKHDVKWEKPVTKEHILFNSIYVKRPEEVNPERQKMDKWLPEAGRMGWGEEWLFNRYGTVFLGGLMEGFWNW